MQIFGRISTGDTGSISNLLLNISYLNSFQVVKIVLT